MSRLKMAAVLGCLMVGVGVGSASAEETIEQKLAPFKPFYVAAGDFAYTSGVCSRWMTPGAKAQVEEVIAGSYNSIRSDNALTAEFKRMMKETMDDLYAEGQRDPLRLKLSASSCKDMIDETVQNILTEGDKLSANRK